MKFVDRHELTHAIKSHSVANILVIKNPKSESTRVLAVYKYLDMCKWRLWATKMSGEENFQIKLLNNNHTCIRDNCE